MSHQPEFEYTGPSPERTPNDICIVSCGIGPQYQEGLYSTRLHCEVNVPEAWRLFYRDYPPGCPSHSDQMYAFKIWALRNAINAGFRYVVWMDATFQPIASMAPLWEVLKREGWYCAPQGIYMLGEWASDYMLFKFGIDREKAFSIPLVYSGLVALDMLSHAGKAIWNKWQYSQNQGLWNGAHYNSPGSGLREFGLKTKGHVSSDKRVSGHRHDEAALSAILYQEGLVPAIRNFLTVESPEGFIDHHVKLVIPRRPALREIPPREAGSAGNDIHTEGYLTLQDLQERYLTLQDLQKRGIK